MKYTKLTPEQIYENLLELCKAEDVENYVAILNVYKEDLEKDTTIEEKVILLSAKFVKNLFLKGDSAKAILLNSLTLTIQEDEIRQLHLELQKENAKNEFFRDLPKETIFQIIGAIGATIIVGAIIFIISYVPNLSDSISNIKPMSILVAAIIFYLSIKTFDILFFYLEKKEKYQKKLHKFLKFPVSIILAFLIIYFWNEGNPYLPVRACPGDKNLERFFKEIFFIVIVFYFLYKVYDLFILFISWERFRGFVKNMIKIIININFSFISVNKIFKKLHNIISYWKFSNKEINVFIFLLKKSVYIILMSIKFLFILMSKTVKIFFSIIIFIFSNLKKGYENILILVKNLSFVIPLWLTFFVYKFFKYENLLTFPIQTIPKLGNSKPLIEDIFIAILICITLLKIFNYLKTIKKISIFISKIRIASCLVVLLYYINPYFNVFDKSMYNNGYSYISEKPTEIICKTDKNKENVNTILICQFYPLNQKSIFSGDFNKIDIARLYFENMQIIKDNYKKMYKLPFELNIKIDERFINHDELERLIDYSGNDNISLPNVYILGEYLQSNDKTFIFNHVIFKDTLYQNTLLKISNYLLKSNELDSILPDKNLSSSVKRDDVLEQYIKQVVMIISSNFKMFEFSNSVSYISGLNTSPDMCFHYIMLIKYLHQIIVQKETIIYFNKKNKSAEKDLYLKNIKSIRENIKRELDYLINLVSRNNNDSNDFTKNKNDFLFHLRSIYLFYLNWLPLDLDDKKEAIYKSIEIISDIFQDNQDRTKYPFYYKDLFEMILQYKNDFLYKDDKSLVMVSECYSRMISDSSKIIDVTIRNYLNSVIKLHLGSRGILKTDKNEIKNNKEKKEQKPPLEENLKLK